MTQTKTQTKYMEMRNAEFEKFRDSFPVGTKIWYIHEPDYYDDFYDLAPPKEGVVIETHFNTHNDAYVRIELSQDNQDIDFLDKIL